MPSETLGISVEAAGGGAVVVRLSGRFDGAGAAEFDRVALPRIAGAGAAGAVLDFERVAYLSSAGIRSLVRAGQAAPAGEGRLVLAALSPFISHLLEVSGLLGRFTVAGSASEGLRLASPGKSPGAESASVELFSRRYEVRRAAGDGAPLERWGGPGTRRGEATASSLASASLAELGLAVGVGGLGANRAEAAEALGPFLSTGRLVAVAPESPEGGGEPDFLLSARPEESTFHVAWATGLVGPPPLEAALPEGSVPAGELVRDLGALAPGPGEGFAFVVSAGLDPGRSLLAVGLAPGPDGEPFRAHALFLEGGSGGGSGRCDLKGALAAAEELSRVAGVARLGEATPLLSPHAWAWPARTVREGAAKQTLLELAEEGPFPDEWAAIARRVYAGSSRVLLRRLAGGYSSVTFQAESWDREGRRTIPTVLKIATHAFTDREERAYHECVKSFILNNATVIMGRAAEGEWSGLRYNFLGVGGPESRIAWLGERYAGRPFEEVEPLFDALFGTILDPWYGQTREEEIDLGREHDPSELFPRLSEDAASALGIDPDAPTFDCPEVGAVLPNPYLFLRDGARSAGGRAIRWPRCVTHGDLNLNNVLVDEKENLFVIDFSETRRRNAVSDFARLEALVALQTTRVADERDAVRVCRFFEGLVSVRSLDEAPPLVPDGEGSAPSPELLKAWRLATLLRRHAARVVSPRRELVPYLFPLLQWTAPIVSFRQCPVLLKRVSLVASALVVRRILEPGLSA